MPVKTLILWIWGVVGVVWILGSLWYKRVDRAESWFAGLRHFLLLVVAMLLLFREWLRISFLEWRWVPRYLPVEYTGLLLTLAGAVFAIWARVMLGGNWSSNVTVKREHQLILRGPYRIVRHPIYSGFLLAMLGTALVWGELRLLIGVLLAGLSWWLKSRTEEAFMIRRFGDQYLDYRKRVSALIPGVF